MNETIISNHNGVVKPEDTVYLLGDFAFVKTLKELEEFIVALNGKKYFVIGSHDKIIEKNIKYLLRYFGWIKEKTEIKVDGCDITLCHYPMWSWGRSHYDSFQLFGHHHGNLNKDHRSQGELDLSKRRQMDVGVDCNNFFPFSLEQIKAEMAKKDFTPINSRKEIKNEDG